MTDGPLRRTFGIATIDKETREDAIEEPGRTWKEWFYFEFLKVWTCLGLFIIDSLFAAYWLSPFNAVGLAGSLLLLVYGDYLLYQYLWHRADPGKEGREREFRPTWYRPVRFGRWTPETWRIRAGIDPFGSATVGPDPREFL